MPQAIIYTANSPQRLLFPDDKVKAVYLLSEGELRRGISLIYCPADKSFLPVLLHTNEMSIHNYFSNCEENIFKRNIQ